MQKVLITGSEGFVGKHLVPLMKKDYFVIGISRKDKLESDSFSAYHNGDILDTSFIYGLLEKYKPEAIIHLAAIATSWSKELEELYKVNFFGTLNILECIVKFKHAQNHDPRILYVSTSEVYGKTKNLEKINEDSPFFPLNFYAVSKLAADRLSYQYSQNHKLKIVIARAFNHTGPGQKKGFFVPDMISQIVEVEKSNSKESEIEVGNLEAIRDFSDVRDISRAYKMLVEANFEPGEAYNICSGRGIKAKDILDKLINLSKKEIVLKHDSKRTRPSEVPIQIGDNEKLKNLTGWSSEIDIDKTLEDTLSFWRTLH